jgi:hypothetical protein
MQRRALLKLLTLTIGGVLTEGFSACAISPPRPAPESSEKKGLVFLCYSGDSPNTSILRIWNWDKNEHHDFDLPLALPHSIVQDRQNPETLFVFEVFGSCARVDLTSGKAIKIDHRSGLEMFNGHAIQTLKGDILVCSQIDVSKSRAHLTLRSSDDLHKIATLPPACDQAHQIVQVPGGTIAACGNGPSAQGKLDGGITFFDYESQTIVRRVNLPFPIIHLLALSPSEVVGIGYHFQNTHERVKGNTVSFHRESIDNINQVADQFALPAPVFRVNIDGRFETLWDEPNRDNFRYGFGLARLPETMNFLSGYKDSGKIIFWENSHPSKILSVDAPTNILVSNDSSEFLVVSDGAAHIYSVKEFKQVNLLKEKRTLISASSLARSAHY